MSPARLTVAALATWRVAHLVAYEDGPANVVARARERAGTGLRGDLMDCFYCLSLWAAIPFTLAAGPRRRDVVQTWLALSGAACLLERATSTEQQGGWNVLWEEPSLGGGPDEADARKPGRPARTEAAPAETRR